MNCYLDSSVVLRRLFDEPNPLKEWSSIRIGFSSRVLGLECFRTVDWLRASGQISSEEAAEYLADLRMVMSNIGILPLTSPVFRRAEQAFPSPLGSLDGIHLATALLWRERHGDDLTLATHDRQMAVAAHAYGIPVIGI